jgi:hypothetical protein
VSEAGIDHRVSRQNFRSAVEQGCGICVPFYERLREIDWRPEFRPFWVFDDDDPSVDDQELVINYTAEINLEGGSYNVEKLEVDPCSGEERGNHCTSYYLYAEHGNNMLSFRLFAF